MSKEIFNKNVLISNYNNSQLTIERTSDGYIVLSNGKVFSCESDKKLVEIINEQLFNKKGE